MISNAGFVPYFAEGTSCAFWVWILYRRFRIAQTASGHFGIRRQIHEALPHSHHLRASRGVLQS